MEKRFRGMLYTPSALSDKEMQSIREKYDFYRITYKNGKVAGRPIYFVRHSEAYERMVPDLGQRYVLQTGDRDKRLFQPDETRRHRLQQCGGCGAETRVEAEIHRHVR